MNPMRGDNRFKRRSAPPNAPGLRRPRPPNKLPQEFGWLIKLVPEALGYRSQLEYLLRDEAMQALLAAAPPSISRPLRSLCWMLRLDPPPIPPPLPPSRRAAGGTGRRETPAGAAAPFTPLPRSPQAAATSMRLRPAASRLSEAGPSARR
jgi:hypothetical protein